MGKYRQCKEILVREDINEIILFNPENGELHKVNQDAFYIWKLLGKPLAKDKLITAVNQKYKKTPKEDIQKKVEYILNYFLDKNLVFKDE